MYFLSSNVDANISNPTLKSDSMLKILDDVAIYNKGGPSNERIAKFVYRGDGNRDTWVDTW